MPSQARRSNRYGSSNKNLPLMTVAVLLIIFAHNFCRTSAFTPFITKSSSALILRQRKEQTQRQQQREKYNRPFLAPSVSFALSSSSDNLADLLTSRLPTSVDDQIRQTVESIKRATADGKYRHIIRLLLPVIGATELDDWPGGSRQQMEAANPLVQDILQRITPSDDNDKIPIQSNIIDESDGVAALFVQAPVAKDDSCTVLLPTADTVAETIQSTLEKQVGNKRNLILVNPQWKRKSDFGGNSNVMMSFFGRGGDTDQQNTISYIEEQFIPTFSLTNFICEGESVRVLRTYPGPWRVFIQQVDDVNTVDWIQIGAKDVVEIKPSNWDTIPYNQQDGGLLFNHGQPSYDEIVTMIISAPNYKAKSPAERAAAAFNFIKDTL